MPSVALALLTRAAVPAVAPSGIPGDPEFAGMVRARRRELHAVTVQLADGLINADEWATRMRAILMEGHTRAAYFGRMVALQEEAVAELADVIAAQIAIDGEEFYLRGFLADLMAQDERYWDKEAGRWIEDRIKARQDQYLGKMRGTANAAFMRHSPAESLFDWVLGAAEDHCEECPEYAGWGSLPEQEWPTHPGDNDTPCMFNCTCFMRRDDGAAGFQPVEL